MRQTQLFTKTRREAPADEVSKNAQLLIRAGFIHKEMAGAYDLLPLGLRVIEKIRGIIREEMNAIGGQELHMTTLQGPELWEKTGRFDDAVVDNWFKTKLTNGTELGIANTHEEPITAMLTHHINSYKDLPAYVYQFQTKFRNELRAKSGIMRAREFLMKDFYSFNRTEEDFKAFYEKAAEAYTRIFMRAGIGNVTYRTVAAGGTFTTGFTDEFQTISDAGEDIIYVDKEKGIAVNKEVYNDDTLAQYGLDKASMVEEKSIEVGNIFPLGTKYPDAMGLTIKDENGEQQQVHMGSYGIGLGRLMGTVVEVLSDEKGIVWPASIAPFGVHLVSMTSNDEVVVAYADALYEELTASGVEVLYDDRDARAGEKLADADLIGIPTRILIGKDTISSGAVEVVDRATAVVKKVTRDELLSHMGSVASAEIAG
ncbi:MAG: putative prolyl-tRNA synthetase, prolyl-tRNA synthetase [Parcubacteria group bacterium]|jgi:prolyl-tRNA synthetase|nr:putative prolyl-tRNA synthetase, prolyl-tRNA synthetase [Parcubacteria group bacterium]